MTIFWKGLIERSAIGFPFQHFIAHIFNNFERIAYHDFSFWNNSTFWNKSQGTYDTIITNDDMIHNHCIDTHQNILADSRTMNYRTMPDVCTFHQSNRQAWKHVHSAVLLNIATIFNNYLPPITTQSRTRTDVHILSYNNISGNRSIRMNKSRGMNDRLDALEFKDVCHLIYILNDDRIALSNTDTHGAERILFIPFLKF